MPSLRVRFHVDMRQWQFGRSVPRLSRRGGRRGRLPRLAGAVTCAALTALLAPTPARAAAPPFVACPIAKVAPIGPLPSPSPLPVRDPSRPLIGGAGLDTKGLTVPAGAPALPTNVSATSWLVADLDTGAVLGACGPHEYGAPASLQKLLLAQTVLPKLDPADVITVTAGDMDFEPGSSAVGLVKGGEYSVQTLWLGLFLNSGNDAANVLARLGGGGGLDGVATTMADMNAEAERLGAWDTHAETPSGLDGPGQVTSVYDLALITRALFARDDFRRYVATMSAQVPAQPHLNRRGFQIQNDNRLMYEYDGAIGGKTGFTDIARHTYVGAAERDGRRLVVAVLGAERRPVRVWVQGAALLDWGFALPRDASVGRLVSPVEVTQIISATTPTPIPSTARASVAGADERPPPTAALIGVAVLGAVFAGVWTAVMLAHRRRVAARRLAAVPGPLPAPRVGAPETSATTSPAPPESPADA